MRRSLIDATLNVGELVDHDWGIPFKEFKLAASEIGISVTSRDQEITHSELAAIEALFVDVE